MEKNESIEHVLENMDKNIVYKTKSPVYIPLILIVAGIISFALYTSIEWTSSSSFPHFLFMLGAIIMIWGIIQFFFRKSYFVSTENHQKLKISEIYFQLNERDRLVKLMENGNIKELRELKTSVSDGLRLRVMTTKDGNICLSQIVTYAFNNRINVNDVKNHSKEDARFFIDFFNKIKR